MRQLHLSPLKLVEIFVNVDDFLIKFTPVLQKHLVGEDKWSKRAMNKSEVMSILIFFHLSGFRNFKTYYQVAIKGIFRSYFRTIYPYEHFVSLQSSLSLELYAYLNVCCLSKCDKANYIDSTSLKVCHIKREKKHKVFKGLAQKGKNSMGFFFGFKLHVICNQKGEIVRILLTSGNKADNNEKVLTELLADLEGNIYGDKGYITKLKPYFQEKKVKLITKVRKNMKPEKLSQEEKYFLYKRGLIETVIELLKNECQIEHTRHRSPKNFMVNLWSAIIAYKFLDKKPCIEEFQEKKLLPNIELFQDSAA